MSILTIDIAELATMVADDLQITDEDIKNLKEGLSVPDNWSNAIMDRLQDSFNLEDLLIDELTKE